MCLKFAAISILIAAALPASPRALGLPAYTIEQAVAVAQEHNPEILIARKKVVAARGGFIEARSGFLPSLTSNGLYDKRRTQSETSLRQEDYNATLRLEQNLYTGRSEEHTSELQSQSNLVCRLLLEKKKDSAPLQARRAHTLITTH